MLPVIGLPERAGLRERAQALIADLRQATTGRILILYLLIRQLSAALDLTALGGHAQMVRPLIAPMAAAVDNIGVFFGEDIFIAIASILLIKGFLQINGIDVQPLHPSVWAIPTAVMALVMHTIRLLLLDRRLRRLGRTEQAVVLERAP